MIESLQKAFKPYSKHPFFFVWGSLLYILLLIVGLFAAIGLFLMYFMFLSAFGQELNLESIATIAVIGIIAVLFLFYASGLNAGLAMTYREALGKGKTSLKRFFSYSVERAPEMFGIMLIRELVWLFLVGPFIFIYFQWLVGYEFLDLLIGGYALFMTFIIHMFFTPAFVLAGAFGTGVFSSLHHGVDVLRRKHIFFIGLYAIFAAVWLLNFIPFIQIATLFFAYPVVYSAMAVMIENAIKIKRVEDD